MGTSLTGTKPKDTYDSLIKVGDNGPISGTAKYLSDGLGNDLPISVSTSNVGIGTSAPDTLVTLGSTARTDNTAGIKIFRGGGTASYATYGFAGNAVINSVGGDLVIQRESSERARFTTAGLCFNGDFAAANALDDYEEGTFTLTFAGNSVAGTYTPTAVNATYTKIGRVVTLQYKATFAGGASGGSGYMQITGLPFNYAADSGGLTGTLILSDASWGGSYLSMIPVTSGSSNQIIINETSPSTGLTNFVQASDFGTSTDIRFTLTYQV
jgi:hypothetical protein